MNIRILELIDGAQAAKGLTVIIDVFRAMTVEAFLLHGAIVNPTTVIPSLCPMAMLPV